MLVLGVLVLTLNAAPPKSEFDRYVFAASQLFDKLEFERAYEQLLKAKALSRGVKDDVLVGLYEGILRAELHGIREAEASFRTALLLDPDAMLPVKVSPTVRDLFDRLRTETRKTFADKRPPKEDLKSPVAESSEPAVSAAATRDTRPWALVPGVVGVLLAGGGTVLLFLAQGAHQQLTTTSPGTGDGAALRDRGELYQTLGFVGIGVGAAAVAAALGWAMFGAPSSVSVAAGPGSVSFAWSGSL